MQRLFLLVGLFTGIDLCAQEFQPDINKLMERSPFSTLKKDTSQPQLRSFDLKMLSARAQKPAPGVYALPQDGMPYIVPNTQNIATIPNAAKNNSVPPANRIPNAARTPAPKGGGNAAENSR